MIAEIREQVQIAIKYEGYIERQQRQVAQFQKMEQRILPKDIVYEDILGLRREATQKLARFQPASVGEASRIGGVNPADIQVLLVYLDAASRRKTK